MSDLCVPSMFYVVSAVQFEVLVAIFSFYHFAEVIEK